MSKKPRRPFFRVCSLSANKNVVPIVCNYFVHDCITMVKTDSTTKFSSELYENLQICLESVCVESLSNEVTEKVSAF